LRPHRASARSALTTELALPHQTPIVSHSLPNTGNCTVHVTRARPLRSAAMPHKDKLRPICRESLSPGDYSAHVTARSVSCDEAVPNPAGDCFATPLRSVPRNDKERLSSYVAWRMNPRGASVGRPCPTARGLRSGDLAQRRRWCGGLAPDARQMEPDWGKHHAAHDTKNVHPVVSLEPR